MTEPSKIEDIERRLHRLEWELQGKCPECGQKIQGWIAPSGAFAPEAWATLREHGIDPKTGHKENCQNKIR